MIQDSAQSFSIGMGVQLVVSMSTRIPNRPLLPPTFTMNELQKVYEFERVWFSKQIEQRKDLVILPHRSNAEWFSLLNCLTSRQSKKRENILFGACYHDINAETSDVADA